VAPGTELELYRPTPPIARPSDPFHELRKELLHRNARPRRDLVVSGRDWSWGVRRDRCHLRRRKLERVARDRVERIECALCERLLSAPIPRPIAWVGIASGVPGCRMHRRSRSLRLRGRERSSDGGERGRRPRLHECALGCGKA
jgi:hypothetical protein